MAALHELGVEVVMLTGDNQATAERIAAELGIEVEGCRLQAAEDLQGSPSAGGDEEFAEDEQSAGAWARSVKASG